MADIDKLLGTAKKAVGGFDTASLISDATTAVSKNVPSLSKFGSPTKTRTEEVQENLMETFKGNSFTPLETTETIEVKDFSLKSVTDFVETIPTDDLGALSSASGVDIVDDDSLITATNKIAKTFLEDNRELSLLDVTDYTEYTKDTTFGKALTSAQATVDEATEAMKNALPGFDLTEHLPSVDDVMKGNYPTLTDIAGNVLKGIPGIDADQYKQLTGLASALCPGSSFGSGYGYGTQKGIYDALMGLLSALGLNGLFGALSDCALFDVNTEKTLIGNLPSISLSGNIDAFDTVLDVVDASNITDRLPKVGTLLSNVTPDDWDTSKMDGILDKLSVTKDQVVSSEIFQGGMKVYEGVSDYMPDIAKDYLFDGDDTTSKVISTVMDLDFDIDSTKPDSSNKDEIANKISETFYS